MMKCFVSKQAACFITQLISILNSDYFYSKLDPLEFLNVTFILILFADKHTYDSALEVAAAFGDSIKESLTVIEATGKSLVLVCILPCIILYDCITSY